MTLLQLTLKNLTRRPIRTVLTVMGIGVGIGAVVALLGLAWGLGESWTDALKARGTDLVVRKASGFLLAEPFDEEWIKQVREVPGVAQAANLLTEVLSIEEAPTVVVSGREWGTFVWDHLTIVDGRLPRSGDEQAVVLGKLAAEQLQKKVGDKITIEVADFTVAGIAECKALVENATVFMSLKNLQNIVTKEKQANFINIRMKDNSVPPDEISKAIVSKLPNCTVETAEDLSDNNEAVKTFKAMNWGTSLIALLVGTFGVMNTMFMSVFERTREIGVLIALGWKRSRILRMIVYESMALCAAAGVLGVVLGVALLKIMARMPIMEGKLEPHIGPDLLGLAMGLALGVGLLSGLYPAFRCTQINPSLALRQ
ncbi:MAG: ABC transporter permease [Verrucomicrobiaceae bacterium]|nr:ABC transporter permease [Verrucomicrobiaceae bacterium]